MQTEIMPFEQAVNCFGDMVTRLCVMRLGNAEDAKDCCQNTFIKLFSYFYRLTSNEHIKHWLLHTAVNECNSAKRKFWNAKSVSLEEIHLVWNDFYDTGLFEILSVLPEKYKTAIWLYYYEGCNVHEISEICGTTEAAVKQRLARGRDALKEKLGDDFCNEQ
jgi:RNA polymerase sigma-70 factor (ECF subfamily)